jgi:hypothetical protein
MTDIITNLAALTQKDKNGLLPCPYCGKPAYLDDIDDKRDGGYVPEDCEPAQ